MKTIAVVAVSADGVFGFKGSMPWAGSVPKDMARFRSLTTITSVASGESAAVVMGRQTWESLPPSFRPLPNRRNIVLSSSLARIEGVAVCRSLENAIALAQAEGHTKLSIIGGKVLVMEAIQKGLVSELYVTIVRNNYLPPSRVLIGSEADHGYLLFPELLHPISSWKGFKLMRQTDVSGEVKGPDLTFLDYLKE